MAVVEFATHDDVAFLCQADARNSKITIAEQVARQEIIVARLDGEVVGWLRLAYFWDSLPFMKDLHVVESHRGQGIGTAIVTFWEDQMRQRGHNRVMTSTMSSETAQHFYRKLGYTDVGGFVLPGEPLELMLWKRLN